MVKEGMPPAKSRKPLVVMKFGGTSVGNAERMQNVGSLLAEHAQQAELAVVVSAMGGITDMLIRAAMEASAGDGEHWKNVRRELARRHREVADQLLSAAEQSFVLPRLAAQVGNFENLCSGFSLVREVTPRAMDTLSSLGEVMSANLMAAILRSLGLAAEAVDATELIVTDDNFGNASPLFEETTVKTRQRLALLRRRGVIPVITGFRGATPEGVCTTLGRGGSDFSGTIIGAALDADEVWIWTDVDGVMTADPRLVPEARIIPGISYREAIELSFFGAKVLHPKTIQPMMKKKIPVWIKNSFNPSCPGTRIVPAAPDGPPGVKAILPEQSQPHHGERWGSVELRATGQPGLHVPQCGRHHLFDGDPIVRGECALPGRARCGLKTGKGQARESFRTGNHSRPLGVSGSYAACGDSRRRR